MTALQHSEKMMLALNLLQKYMLNLYPESTFPLEFWHLEDDEYYEEHLYCLALNLSAKFTHLTAESFSQLPEAIHIAWPIFALEAGYDFSSWTALSNFGVHNELPIIIAAYERIGLSGEAAALQAAYLAVQKEPYSDAVEAAYKSVHRELKSDDKRMTEILNFMGKNSYLWYKYSDEN